MTEQTIIAIKYTLTCRCALQKWSEVKPKIGVKKFLLFYEKFYTIKGTFAILLNEILFLLLRYFRYLINMFLFWLCCTFYFYNFWKNFPDLKKTQHIIVMVDTWLLLFVKWGISDIFIFFSDFSVQDLITESDWATKLCYIIDLNM